MENRIETKVDEFFMRIIRDRRVSITQLKKETGVTDEVIERWISIFEKDGFIERVYPTNPLEQPYVVLKHGESR
ncbi:MAG: hypothetical protein JW834_01510 [Candidatus Diapherotrites archaeon]|nr:hypothetical protein [Candidatus Diapherotrites archaeon]